MFCDGNQNSKAMKINKENYDVRYYYIRNAKKNCPGDHALACVCMVRNKKTRIISRGVSICSTREKYFNKMTARGIAFGRAVYADMSEFNQEFFTPTCTTQYAIDTMKDKYGLSWTDDVVCKSEYDIVPTKFEASVWDD